MSLSIVVYLTTTVKRDRSSVTYCDRGGVLSYFDPPMAIVTCAVTLAQVMRLKQSIASCTVSYMVAER